VLYTVYISAAIHRVAAADMILSLVGHCQTLRYADGAKERMILDAPEQHRPVSASTRS
jgi:hypothetical protein